jgi:hypothetical protein
MIVKNFAEFTFLNKINMQAINKDTSLKFTFIDKVIGEWQNPVESIKII